MRKITIGFQISGENIDSVGMMEELCSDMHWKILSTYIDSFV